MIVTNREEVAERARRLKDQAYSREKRFLHTDLGFNYRMTNIQAAIGLAQFEKIDELIERRRKNARLYSELLAGVEGVRLPIEKEWAKSVYWMYSILIEDEFGMSRDELQVKLRENGIDTRAFFIPMNQQPAFENLGLFDGESYPVSEDISKRGMYLPSGSGLKEEEISAVCTAIRRIRQSASAKPRSFLKA